MTTAVQNRLTAVGYTVSSQELHAQEASVQAQDNAFIAIIEILGLLVVAITLIGLVNALTMSVIERTREAGVLRCLGARRRQIRRVFRSEGLMLATTGWAFGADDLVRELWLGGELQVIADARGAASLLVTGPVLRHIQLSSDVQRTGIALSSGDCLRGHSRLKGAR